MRNTVLIVVILIVLVLLLNGCGVDGAPERPAPKPETGLTISGDARIGIATE